MCVWCRSGQAEGNITILQADLDVGERERERETETEGGGVVVVERETETESVCVCERETASEGGERSIDSMLLFPIVLVVVLVLVLVVTRSSGFFKLQIMSVGSAVVPVVVSAAAL